MGGDIHRPRAIEHDTAATVGYPLLELISSPMHERVIGRPTDPILVCSSTAERARSSSS